MSRPKIVRCNFGLTLGDQGVSFIAIPTAEGHVINLDIQVPQMTTHAVQRAMVQPLDELDGYTPAAMLADTYSVDRVNEVAGVEAQSLTCTLRGYVSFSGADPAFLDLGRMLREARQSALKAKGKNVDLDPGWLAFGHRLGLDRPIDAARL